MKSFLEKSKRALVLLLTGAMIATSVPSTAFAATLGTDADNVIIEEVTDAVANDAVVEEEVVANEPSEAVEALGAVDSIEPSDESDSVEADADNITRTISTAWAPIGNSVSSGDADYFANGDYVLTYGETFGDTDGNIVLTATAVPGLSTEKGAQFEVYTYTETTTIPDLVNDETYKDEGSPDIELVPDSFFTGYGLSISKSETTGKLTISGRPTKKLDKKYFMIKVTDKEDVNDAAHNDIKWTKISLTIEGKPIKFTAQNSGKGNKTNEGSGADASTNVLYLGNGGTQKTTKMGYEVYKKGTDVPASVTDETSFVVGESVVLELDATSLDDLVAINSSDLTYTWEGDDAACFEPITADYTDGKGISNTKKETIVIAPKAGLTAKGDKNKDGNYVATLKITSDKIAAEKKIYVKFTVTSALGITSVIDIDGDEIVKDYAGGTANPFDLGSFEIGENIGNIVIKAENNTTNTVSIVGFAGSDGPFVDADGSQALSASLPSGLRGTAVSGSGFATYTLSGAVDSASASAGDYFFVLCPGDDDATASVNKGKLFKFKLVKAKDVVDISVDGTAIESGSTSKEYKWYTPWISGTENEYDNDYATVTVQNTGAAALTLSLSTDTGSINSGSMALEKSTLSVGAGKTATFKVTPTVADNDGSGANDLLSNKKVTISGTGFETTTIDMQFKAIKDSILITEPYAATENTTVAITEASVGDSYSYAFEAATADANTTWSLLNVSTTTISDHTVTSSTAEADLAKYGLALSSGGVLSGTPTKAATHLYMTVKARTNAGNDAYRIVDLVITTNPDGLTAKSGTKELGTTASKTLDLGSVVQGSTDTISSEITLVNNMDIKQSGIKAVVTGIDKNSSGFTPDSGKTITDYFDVVYDADTTKNNMLKANGLELTAGGDGKVKLVGKALLGSGTNAGVGTYKVEVTVSGAGSDSIQFYATVKVTAGEVINPSAVDAYTFKKGVTVPSSTKYATVSGKTCCYAVTTGALPDGLELDYSSGIITGTPTKVGEYEFTVTAYTTASTATEVGTLKHKITVAGNSTLTLGIASDSDIVNDSVIMPGAVVGGTTGKFTVTVGAATEQATGVKVTIADADDDRKPSDPDDYEDYKKNPANPYTGSTNFLGVSATTLSDVGVGGAQTFDVVQKSSATAGVYKAKVTVSADNAAEKSFNVIYVVTEKLVITQPGDLETSIGSAITADKYEISATGAADAQTIKWAEAGTGTGTKKYYITANGASGGTSTETGLSLTTEGSTAGVKPTTGESKASNNGRINDVTTTKMKVAGEYDVNLTASVDPLSYTNINGSGSDLERIIERSSSLTSTVATMGNVVVVPRQTAETKSFKIKSTESDKAFVAGLRHASGTVTVNGGNTIGGTVDGTKLGNGYGSITGYTWPTAVLGYNNTVEGLTIAVNDPDNSGLLKATPALTTGTNFLLVSKVEKTLDDAYAATWVVQPKADLPVGTYTDTITFAGTNLKSVTLNIKFVVEQASYLLTVDNNIDPDDDDVTKRVAYATNNIVDSKALITLKPMITDGAAPAAETFTIRNTGNSAITGIEVYEAKNKNGDKYASGDDGPFLTVTDATKATLATKAATYDSATFTLRIAPASQSEAGEYNTFVAIKSTEGSIVVIPVTYTVVSKTTNKVTVTPNEDTSGFVTVATKAEGYAPAESATTFTVTNTGTTATDTIIGLNVALAGGAGSSFVVTTDLTDEAKAELKAGENATFVISPKPGLEKGTYTETVEIGSGSNIKNAPIKKKISFTVTESKKFELDKVNSASATPVTGTFAERLYNTVVYGLTASATMPKVNVAAASGGASGTQVVKLDLDANGKWDVDITFSGTESGSTLTAVTGADVQLDSQNNITSASKGFALTTSQQGTAARDGIGAKGCFNEVSFKLYGKLVFGTSSSAAATDNSSDGTVYSATKKEIDNDFVTVDRCISGTTTIASGTNVNYVANGQITAYVPFGQTAASVFTDSKLPVAVADNKISSGWKYGTTSELKATDKIYKSLTLDPVMYGFVYAVNGSTGNDDGVTWTWTAGANGDMDAVLTLTDITGDYDELSKIVVDKDSKVAAGGVYPSVTAPVTIVDNGLKGATCTQGGHKEYEATATVAFSVSDSRTYTGTYSTNDDGKAKGHTYSTVIAWEKQEDGSYKAVVTQTCSVCDAATSGHKFVATTVTVDKTIKKEATCTVAGEATYTITSFIDGNGKTVSAEDVKKIANYSYTAPIDPKGHKYKLVVEWNDNHKTAKSAKLVCDQCETTETDHEIDVTSKITYDTKYDETTGDVTSNQAIYNAGKDDEVKSDIWTSHEHKWVPSWAEWTRKDASDKFSWTTTLTLTCNEGVSPEIQKPEVTVTKTADGDKYIDYVATATFNGQTYTSETYTVDSETGEPTSKHEHKWSAPSWKWNSSADATATFTCTVGKETKDVAATITTVKTNSKGNTQYKATVTGPDNKEYSDLQWYDASGNPASGEGIGIEGLETEYEYTGKQIKPAFTVVDYSIDKTLALGVDYTVKYGKNVDAGENAGSVTITGKGNYDKQEVSETFTIVDPFKDADKDNYIDNVASVTLPKATYFYDGTPKMPATITIKSKAKPAEVITATLNAAGDGYEFGTDSKEAYISVSNNINKGSATVSVRGKSDTKAKIKTFPIKALDLTTVTAEDLTFDPDDAVYAVKGAIPANLNVEYKGTPLVLGQDYTVKYSYTSKTKDAGDDAGSFKITGKGNFAKTFGTAQTFNIVPLTLEDDAVSVAAYDKANGAKLQAVVADGNGVKIPAKQLVVTSSKTAKLVAGDEIEVTVKGANEKNISGEVTLNIKVAENLKTAKVAIAKGYAVQYTGEAINLEDLEKNPFEDGTITVTAKKAGKLEYGTDFEIAGYANNVKKGNMTVVIRGIGEKVSGNKEVKIKISAKTVKKAE